MHDCRFETCSMLDERQLWLWAETDVEVDHSHKHLESQASLDWIESSVVPTIHGMMVTENPSCNDPTFSREKIQVQRL